jgi:DoxX-like family
LRSNRASWPSPRNAQEARMILRLLATWIPALIIALSGAMKLARNPQILESMTALGVRRYVPLLGVMELAFAALFVVPATFKLGFILASCYFGGAIATELSHDALKANPFIPIVLLWIGAFIRDRSIFF